MSRATINKTYNTTLRNLLIAICFPLSSIRDITEGKPLPLEVTGIEYMNDDPAMVDILYAKVNVKDRSDK